MIVCDKCGSLIEEKLPDEPKDETKKEMDEDSPRQRRYKKDPPKDEPPAKRSSLVNLPFQYGVNCYIRRDFDLCESCQSFLNKELDKVRFAFIRPSLEDVAQ